MVEIDENLLKKDDLEKTKHKFNAIKWIVTTIVIAACVTLSIVSYNIDSQKLSLAKDLTMSISIPFSVTFALTLNITKIGNINVGKESTKSLSQIDIDLYLKLDKKLSNLNKYINEEKNRHLNLTNSTIYEDIEKFILDINEDLPSFVFKDTELNEKFKQLIEESQKLLESVYKTKSPNILGLIFYNIKDNSYFEIRNQIQSCISDLREIYRKKCD